MKMNQYVLKQLDNICFQVLLSGLLLFPLTAFPQTHEVSVWAAPCEQKIRPKDPVEKNNLVWTQAGKKINIAGAGNQHVAFQVVITTPVPEGYKPKAAGGFFISVSDLTSSQGKIIPNEQIKCYLEHYILLYGKSSPVGATGYWPDALAPLKVPFSMQAQYEVVGNRPVWVDVAIPSGTPAGMYKGTINVTQHGTSLEHLNVTIKVYGFSLPDKTHLITYMNISRGGLARFYHQSDSSKEIDRLTQTYYKFLYGHRMEPWFNDQLQPRIAVHNGKVTVQFNDERYKYYMDSLNTNRVLLNSYPSALKKQITSKQFSPEFRQVVGSYLSQVASYFKDHGWKDRLVFNSPIDEPNTKEDYDNTRSWAALVHQAAPGVPFLATKSPVTSKEHPDWGTLRGYVNNFSIHGNALNDPAVKRAIIEEQAKGGEMTWYISCDQAYPQPNYFIDAPALDPVMVPWITARYQMNGILYWALNFWSETANPWLDAVTFHSGFLCSDGYVLNGEGSLLYPGDYTRQYTGQPNVNGPVSSIRFELLREGIEDYEYLWMLKHLGATDFAEAQTRKLVIDVRTFSRNLEELYLTREAMAQRLEKLTQRK
ncbi:MAG TPA: glycoside hydrolase domain-containing protein [Chitinophagaceae bacterium]|nr:glycoside hydrolase domain-containing protein [Chitinophagaceae bacterium]